MVQTGRFVAPKISIWIPVTRERATPIDLSEQHLCPPPSSPETPMVTRMFNFGEFVFFAGWLRHRGAAFKNYNIRGHAYAGPTSWAPLTEIEKSCFEPRKREFM